MEAAAGSECPGTGCTGDTGSKGWSLTSGARHYFRAVRRWAETTL